MTGSRPAGPQAGRPAGDPEVGVTEKKLSMCRFCECDCGIVVTLADGRPVRARGDEDHPVSQGYACGKQMATVDVTNDPDRIVQPMKRVDGKLEPISWSQALTEIGARVREIKRKHGAGALGTYTGNPAAFNFATLVYLRLFRKALGIYNAWSAASQDVQNRFFSSELLFGSSLIQTFPDVENTDCLIILGGNPVASGGSGVNFPRAAKRLKAIDQRGKVWVIDPRRTETARAAGEHVFIRPDTDVFFLSSMLHLIFQDPRYEHAALARVAEGIEQLREAVAPYPPEVTEGITGIPARKVEEIVDSYLSHSRSALYNRFGTDLGTLPTYADWLVKAVNLVSNRMDREGCVIFSKQTIAGARLAQRLGERNGRIRSRIRDYPSTLGLFPAGVMADEILTPGEGQVRGLFTISGNPVITTPNGNKLEEALRQLDLFVAIDFYETDTAVHADYVLPPTSSLERDGINLTGSNFQPIPYLQYVEAVVRPRGEARDDWRILKELTIACRYSSSALRALARALYPNPKPLAFLLAAMRGVSPIKLLTHPHGVRMEGPHYHHFLGKAVLTPSGLANLDPNGIPEIRERASARFRELRDAERPPDQLLMISLRDRRSQNSWLHNCPSLMKNRSTNVAQMNPVDAERLEISTDDLIRVENRLGRLELPVKVTDEVMAGVIVVPHGWGHNPRAGWRLAASTTGVNSNLLCDDQTLERPSGHPHMNGIPVRVSPAPSPERAEVPQP